MHTRRTCLWVSTLPFSHSPQVMTQTCHQASSGRVPFMVTGDLQFGYEDRTHGHYLCTSPQGVSSTPYLISGQGRLYINDYASEDRSSYTEFTGSIDGTTTAHYEGHSYLFQL